VDLLQAPAPADRPAAYGAIPLPLLPNMALSAPLAALRSSREAKSALLQDRELWTLAKPLEEKDFKSEQVSALAALSSPAAVLLHRALLLFPSVLQPLATKCDIKTSNEKTGWGAVLKHSHFRGSSWSGPPPTISHLVDLYVERSFSLWKDTEAQQLLLSCATAVSKLVDSNHPCVARCRSAVEAEYPASTPNMYQHLYKGDFSDNLTQLPPMDAPGDAANFFQFGPGHNIPHQHQQEDDADDDAAAAAAVAPYGNPLPIDANALYLLLASLMPWNAPPDGPIPPPPPPPLPPPPTNEEGPGAARNWLDALRDLIGLGNRGMNTANLGTEEGVAGGSTSQAAGQEQGASELESIEDVNEESGEEEGD